MSENDLRKNLYSEVKNRAMLYHHIYSELKKDLGKPQARKLLEKGIYRRGVEAGKVLACYAPADMEGIKNAIMGAPADDGKMFQGEVVRCDSGGVDIKCYRCPLVEAWQDVGLSEEEVIELCEIATQIDIGTFDGAGLGFKMETWMPNKGYCCIMHITPGKEKA